MTQAASAELVMLIRYLDSQREHILGILEGLDEAALRRPILPSGWSCLGLVQHLTIDVERFWFRAVVAAEPEAVAAFAGAGNAWVVADTMTADDILVLYRRECARANAIIAGVAPDTAPAWWPAGLFGEWQPENLRQIILHTMTETACHAGHLDAVRELIDGRRWLDLEI